MSEETLSEQQLIRHIRPQATSCFAAKSVAIYHGCLCINPLPLQVQLLMMGVFVRANDGCLCKSYDFVS